MEASNTPDNWDEEAAKRECLEEWESHLDWFFKELYPTFASHGFTKSEAYMAYNTIALVNIMSDDLIDGEDGEDGEK